MTADDVITIRKSLGLTQADLAREIGMTARSWQEVEAGRVKLKRIHQLALEQIARKLAFPDTAAKPTATEADLIHRLDDQVPGRHLRSLELAKSAETADTATLLQGQALIMEALSFLLKRD